MKRSSQYLLTKINQIPHLMPFGQNLANYRKSLQINSTGEFLWNLLENETTLEELLSKSASYFNISKENLPEFENDVKVFINKLEDFGIIEDKESLPECFEETLHLSIGGLHLLLQGSVDDFSPEFLPFQTNSSLAPHQTISILHHSPNHPEDGLLIIRTSELMVIDADTKYIITFPTYSYIREVHLSKDGTDARFYCKISKTSTSKEELFHGIRLVFLYIAQLHHIAVIHSASILYEGKAWLFSGPSGTGKSTHTNLWKEYMNVPILNGDLNLISIENGIPVIHGLPWCGTSQISDTSTYPLGGITLLRKAPENHIEQLSPDKKAILISQRFISPAWTSQQLEENLSIAEELLPHILVTKLHCTKEKEAFETIKKEIDFWLNQA